MSSIEAESGLEVAGVGKRWREVSHPSRRSKAAPIHSSTSLLS